MKPFFFGLSEHGVCPKFDCVTLWLYTMSDTAHIDQVLLVTSHYIPVYIPIMDGCIPLKSPYLPGKKDIDH